VGASSRGERAHELLERWFGRSRHGLPAELADWCAAARAQPAPPPLKVESGERRLRARLVSGGDEDLVLLSEHDTTLPAAALAQLLPITRREAEVLARLATGATNDGIAHDLAISRHTVIRHVEHLYAKLAVHTRAAATRAALDALRDE
jgi:DNA-binding CsgD family transcriptional regulator